MGQFQPNTGSFPAFLQPTQNKELYTGNYLNFTDDAHNQWSQQFMPDLYKKIAPKYGSNQTIAGFLSMITNGEMSANSDQIIWQEEGRLHTRYEKLLAIARTTGGAVTTGSTAADPVAASRFIEFVLNADQAGPGGNADPTPGQAFQQQNAFTNAALNQTQPNINFRVGQTVMAQKEGSDGAVVKGVVTAVSGKRFVIAIYNASSLPTSAGTVGTWTALVYGSEFGKGTGNFVEKKDSEYSTYSNQLIILKEHYSINGTDLSQIGWIDTGEGYLWYHKSKSDNMKLWNDYMEMALVEGVLAENGGALPNGHGDYRPREAATATEYDADGLGQGSSITHAPTARGTEGFFAALENRGNVYQGFGDEATGGGALTDFDNLLKQLDKQGSIEENMIYTDRDLSLEIDDILAQQNSYGAGGTSWGAFNNSEKMALDLGFSGFRRGSYDFYKTDWRYLNDHSTRGGFSDIEGVLIPAGTSTVYEKFGNGKVKRPFLHVRFREGRKMKNWMTGGAGGASTSDIDEVRHHYLTERCLITQAANNFVLFKK